MRLVGIHGLVGELLSQYILTFDN